MPLFTIVIPTHNRVVFLRKAIESVRAQTFTDWEMIVVDDGSQPPARDAIDDLLADVRIRYHWQESQGPGGARRCGLNTALGKYLCFLDDDDYYLPNHLQHLAEAILSCPGPECIYATGMITRKPDGRLLEGPLFDNDIPVLPQYWSNPCSLHPFAIPLRAARRWPIDVRPSPIEDFEWLCRLLSNLTFRQLSDYTVVYVEHAQNRTNNLVSRDWLHLRERSVDDAYNYRKVTRQISHSAYQSMITHQRLHWVRQCLRQEQFRDALFGLRRGLKSMSFPDLNELAYTFYKLIGALVNSKKTGRFVKEIVKGVGRQLARKLVRIRLKNLQFKAEDALIIFAQPRGGSTWLLELLSKLPGVIPNYEPLHPAQAQPPAGTHLGLHPFVEPSKITPVHQNFLDDCLTYRHCAGWTTDRVQIKHILNPNFVLVKFVRANGLLRYFLSNYQFARRPIMLLRHPLAIAISHLDSFRYSKADHLWKVREDGSVSELYLPHLSYLNGLETELERRLAVWCIHNVDLMVDSTVWRQVHVIFYEHLVMEPYSVLRELLDEWQFPDVPDDYLKKLDVRRPSITDHRKKFRRDPSAQLRKMFELTTVGDRRSTQAVLDYFGFKLYNCEDIFPQNLPT